MTLRREHVPSAFDEEVTYPTTTSSKRLRIVKHLRRLYRFVSCRKCLLVNRSAFFTQRQPLLFGVSLLEGSQLLSSV